MMVRGFVVTLLLSAALAYGQLDPNTITVTATSGVTALHPDQMIFAVTVSSGLNTSLDDVLAALAGSGITAANFSNVNGNSLTIITGNPSSLPAPAISWTFALPVPFAKMKDTIAMLTALQKSIAQNNSGLSLSFTIQGTQVSNQLQQMQTCPTSDLLSQARTQAQQLATAANLFVGAVLSMSTATSTTPPCTLTVKFAVTR